MKTLVLNSGSSSLKYQLIDMETETALCSGLVERIGLEVGNISYKKAPDTDAEEKTALEMEIPTHSVGLRKVIDLITDPEKGVVKDKAEISVVGHRVLHGGEHFCAPTIVDDKVLDAIEACIPLGPLHNPANLDGIKVAQELFPGVPQVAVFDTEFHQTMPAHAFMYALPYEMYEQDRIRRYGFHGTSHKYVAGEMAAKLGKPLEECNLITVHLGNGSSMAAVEGGKCVDTTMGLTPLEGLVMGTRSGDVDPAVCGFLARNKNMSVTDIDSILNKKSGLEGICGMSDMRDIHAAEAKGDEKAILAVNMLTYRNKKYIGSYIAALGRVDAIVFTAGIGENDDVVRLKTLQGLERLGIVIDEAANAGRKGEPAKISAADSAIQVWVIPTNEELAIARESSEVLGKA